MANAQQQILTTKEAASYYKLSIWARPTLIYALTSCFVLLTGVICGMLLTGKATFVDASAVLITLIGAIMPVLTALVVGKSWERTKGVRDEENVQATRDNGPDFDGPIRDRPSFDRRDDPSNFDNPNDPRAVLNSMNLDDYMPKVADDEPDLDDLNRPPHRNGD